MTMKKQTFVLPKGQRDLSRVVACISAQPTDREVQITVGPKDRTDLQNSALYGVAYPALAEFTGDTVPSLHDAFLRAYFGEVERTVAGLKSNVPRRTTTTDEYGRKSKLSTVEFNAFYKFIQKTGDEIGCWVPDPDPRWKELKEMNEQAAA